MADMINWLITLETLIFRGFAIFLNAATIAVVVVAIYELARDRGRVRWEKLLYVVIVIGLMQVFLRFLPAMNTKSLAIGLGNARGEMPALEDELQHWRLTNGFGELNQTEPRPTIYVADPLPIVPPPTSPVTRPAPTATVPPPTPTPVVAAPQHGQPPPTPADITRTP